MGIKRLVLEYIDQGNPYLSAAVECAEKFYSETLLNKSLSAKRCLSVILPSLLPILLSRKNIEPGIKGRIAKVLVNAQDCVEESIKVNYNECLISLFSKTTLLFSSVDTSIPDEIVIGKYLLQFASKIPNFKTIVSSMCLCRKSALKECMTRACN